MTDHTPPTADELIQRRSEYAPEFKIIMVMLGLIGAALIVFGIVITSNQATANDTLHATKTTSVRTECKGDIGLDVGDKRWAGLTLALHGLKDDNSTKIDDGLAQMDQQDGVQQKRITVTCPAAIVPPAVTTTTRAAPRSSP